LCSLPRREDARKGRRSSEILKDILGFANAWRRSEAYILIGVEDVRGGRGNVVGIPASDHLDDHSLQQFVNNLTNRPVRFHYEAFGFEGKQTGVIRIDEQTRPVYLKRDYGKLKKNEVYVRRGSSTDPTKPATPDEIALMGTASGSQNAELVVEFAAIGRDSSLGTSLSWDAEFCEMPQRKDIPDYGAEGRYALLERSLVERTNTSFYRQLAEYEFVRRLFRPVRLVVTNTGQVAANEVRVELTIPAGQAVEAIYRSDLPETPRRRNFLYNLAAVQNLRPALPHPGGVTIRKNKERIKIEVECGNLQPGRRVWSEVLYLGMGTTGNISLSGQVFAGNLPQPKDFNIQSCRQLRHHFDKCRRQRCQELD
jgi:hypothetical protein